ncbi:unnamed protein product [Effrenium voratum]|nr:unnamed protein product [Effrenium voratum]
MMAQHTDFTQALMNFGEDVINKRLTEKQVQKAKDIIENIGDKWSFQYFGMVSVLLRQLHGWVESVLKLYRAVHCELDATEGLEMDNDFPLSLYQGGGEAPVEMALVQDVDALWDALNGKAKTLENHLEAVAALGIIGQKCGDRGLQEVAKKVACDNNILRTAAVEALKKAWQPDTAKVDIFMNEVNSQGFAFNQDGCGAAMVDALDYLAPDGERAFESICHGLLSDYENNQQCCFESFERRQSQLDATFVIDRLLDELFQDRQTSWHPTSKREKPNDQQDRLDIICRCMEKAAERDYSAAITGLLASLAPDKAAWERARAASVAARVAKHEDPQAVEAFQALCAERSEHLKGSHLHEVALAFAQLSDARNPCLQALCRELRPENLDLEDALTTQTPTTTLGILAKIAPAGDEEVHAAILHFLDNSQMILALEGPEPLLAAVQVAQQLQCDERSAKTKVMQQLALFLAARKQVLLPRRPLRRSTNRLAPPKRKFHVKAHQLLLELAEQCEGVDASILELLITGFESLDASVRTDCKALLQQIPKVEGLDASSMLLKTIEESCSTTCRCTAIAALPLVAPGEGSIVKLLPLTADRDLAVRSAALDALRECSTKALQQTSGVVEVATAALADGVDTVRLAGLELFACLEPPDLNARLLQCLKDPAEAVVRFALLEVQLGGDLEVAADLLQSADFRIREQAARALGRASNQRAALQVLNAETLWPETNSEVIQARASALAELEKAAFMDMWDR